MTDIKITLNKLDAYNLREYLISVRENYNMDEDENKMSKRVEKAIKKAMSEKREGKRDNMTYEKEDRPRKSERLKCKQFVNLSGNGYINVCGETGYSCERAQQEGLCKRKPT